MVEPKQAEWLGTLARVEEAIGGCLAKLDRYERAFGHTYAEALAPRVALKDFTNDPRLQSVEHHWAERLSTAQAAADEVELLLNEQQGLWGRWLDSYNGWKASVQRMPGDSPEANHAEIRRDSPGSRKVGSLR